MKKTLVIGAVLLVLVLVVAGAGIAYAQTQAPFFSGGFGMMGRGPNGQSGFGPGMLATRIAATPGSGSTAPYGYGYGMMGGRGGRGMMGGGMMANGNYGVMHQVMVDALAKELGMTSADVQAALQSGKTPYQIAQDKGLSTAQIADLMNKVHDEALQQAVASGLLTQAQADWMDQHMGQMWSNGFGPGGFGCPGFSAQPTPGATD